MKIVVCLVARKSVVSRTLLLQTTTFERQRGSLEVALIRYFKRLTQANSLFQTWMDLNI